MIGIEKYGKCIEWIRERRSNGKSWENIEKMELNDNFIEVFDFPKDSKEKWLKVVEWCKDIEDNTEKTIAYVYSDDVNNNISIPSEPGDAWVNFRKNVLMKYGYETVDSSENSAKKILDRLKLESKGQEPGKGLVMGYVQSGKTMNIESVITMGADIGFNIFIMLSGTIENLRKQSLERLRKDIQYTERTNIHWNFIDKIEKDINIEGILTNSSARIVTVCLKNSARLKRLKEWLINYTSLAAKNKMKILLIDDEADQASLNTKRMNFKEEIQERTKINQQIIDIVNCKDFKAMNYISYTATPYGNFLNEKGLESLYPQNFIISLSKSSQYIGALEIFGDRDATSEESYELQAEGMNIKNIIGEDDIEKFENGMMPDSLKNAICWFLCTVAIRRFQKENMPVSMLIHTDNKTEKHAQMTDMVINWLKEEKHDLLDKCKDIYKIQSNKFSKKEFLGILPDYNRDGKHEIIDYPEFEKIELFLKEILEEEVSHILISDEGKLKFHRGIHVVTDNSNNKGGFDENGDFVRLAYPENPQFASAIIVVGGNTLARGLTLNGLTTSYFARKISQVDTLMQMGRWFGYRVGYELLPRIWLTTDVVEKFRETAYIEKRLREDLKMYDLGVKPSEYAPKVIGSYLTKFLLTSKNKSQGAKQVGATYEKVKNQTVVFEKNVAVQKENLEITIDFIKSLFEKYHLSENAKDDNYVWNNVPFYDLVDNLLSKIKFYENDRFYSNIDEFIEWVQKHYKDLGWDIILENTDKEVEADSFFIDGHSVKKVNRSQRDREDVIDIGILRNPKDETNAYYYETQKNGELKNVKKPKLFLYIINGKSKAREKHTVKKDLNFDTDIVGMYMYVPNLDVKDKNRVIVSLN